MVSDILLIVRKEWKELFQHRKGLRGGFLNLAILLFILGVFMPLQSGIDWLSNPLVPLAWTWLPISMTMGIVADAFAGERERNTLETLLSSRLSDRAIVIGKQLAAILYGWGVAEIGVLVAAVTVNLTQPGQGWVFYSPQTYIGCLVLPLLAAGLMAGLGTFVSMRADTVRQASQQLSIGLLVLFVLPIFALQYLPDAWREQIVGRFSDINLQTLLITLAAGWLLVDLVIAAIAIKRFQRTALIV
jgi:ABC-2 type transport system permease protein